MKVCFDNFGIAFGTGAANGSSPPFVQNFLISRLDFSGWHSGSVSARDKYSPCLAWNPRALLSSSWISPLII